jgi:hypothetical protein
MRMRARHAIVTSQDGGDDDEPREMNHWEIMQVYLSRDFEMKEIFVVEIRVGRPGSIDRARFEVNGGDQGSRAGSVPDDLVGWWCVGV